MEGANEADRKRAGRKDDGSKRAKALTIEGDEKPASIRLTLGEVDVENPWGKIIAQIPSALLKGSWIALPLSGHLGGDKLTLHLGTWGEVRLA